MGWGKGGTKFLEPIATIARKLDNPTILDYGCGKGKLVEALNQIGYWTVGYDPCHPDWNQEPEPADLLVSTDVLEHIEPACLRDVLFHMEDLAGKAAFLVVSKVPAVKILPDGRNAHLIVEDTEWWLNTLSYHFPGIQVRDDRRTTVEFTWVRG